MEIVVLKKSNKNDVYFFENNCFCDTLFSFFTRRLNP